VRADEKLTAFVELESAVRACGELPRQAGAIFPKLPGYETKHSTSSNHICARLLCARPKHAGRKSAAGRRLSRRQHGRRAKRPLSLTSGTYNTAVGFSSLKSNTIGNLNTALGVNALSFNTTGVSNTANGVNALYSNTTGVQNTASGVYALFLNTTGNDNYGQRF
jgi:hypothetical protein